MVEKLTMSESGPEHHLSMLPYHCHSSTVIHQHNPQSLHGLHINNNNNNQHNNNNNNIVTTNNNLHKSEFPSVCAGCTGKILDRYYLVAVDQQWHTDCLRCSECKIKLECELTCFAKDGQIYCKDDYYRRFAVKRCARCHLGISANELVMRAKDYVYHLHCFMCEACAKTLTPGEQFGMRDGLVFCRAHYELHVIQGEYLQSLSPSLHSPHIMNFYNDNHVTGSGRRRNKRKSPDPGSCGQGMGIGQENLDAMMDRSEFGLHPPPRQKRMRTSFKHHQLRTMKTYFGLNHNPDAKDLKQLAQKTGLTKRVLQVWFQNARAKHRRNLLRQEQDTLRVPPAGGSVCGTEKSASEDGDQSLAELTNAGSPAMSDISSDAGSMLDMCSSVAGDSANEGDSLTDLFTSSINSIN